MINSARSVLRLFKLRNLLFQNKHGTLALRLSLFESVLVLIIDLVVTLLFNAAGVLIF
jgi:hypothetical protein